MELLQANPNYVHVRYADGRETIVSTRHLAPAERNAVEAGDPSGEVSTLHTTPSDGVCPENTSGSLPNPDVHGRDQSSVPVDNPVVRRSGHIIKPHERLNL